MTSRTKLDFVAVVLSVILAAMILIIGSIVFTPIGATMLLVLIIIICINSNGPFTIEEDKDQ